MLLLNPPGANRVGRQDRVSSRDGLVEVAIPRPKPAAPSAAPPPTRTAIAEKPPVAATAHTGAQSGDAPRAEESQTASAAPDATPPASDIAGIASDFQQRLLAHIQRFRRYPSQALQDRAQGRVELVFRMTRAGDVLDVRIVSSSGSPALDQAAISTIMDAQPLPEIPAGIDDPLDVEIPVEFALPH